MATPIDDNAADEKSDKSRCQLLSIRYTREGAMQAFNALRAQAKENGVADMSLDDINKEIDLARAEV